MRNGQSLIVALIVGFISATAVAQPATRITRYIGTLDARSDAWVATGLEVDVGDLLVLTVDGEVVIVDSFLRKVRSDPHGMPGYDGNGSVLYRLRRDGTECCSYRSADKPEGKDASPCLSEGDCGCLGNEPVGRRFAYMPTCHETTGKLELRVRDSDPSDNSGRYEVNVVLIPAAVLPTPEALPTLR